MKITKVVQTFKDGILTSSKKVDVTAPINPESGKKQNNPKHHRILNLVDAAQVASDEAKKTHDDLVREIRFLRKKLIAAEKATNARIKERDSLKKAYQSKCQKIFSLEEKNEELTAKLFAVSEDLKFLEKSKSHTISTRPTQKINQASPKDIQKSITSSNSSNSSKTNTPNSPKASPNEPVRAIAAKPVKR